MEVKNLEGLPQLNEGERKVIRDFLNTSEELPSDITDEGNIIAQIADEIVTGLVKETNLAARPFAYQLGKYPQIWAKFDEIRRRAALMQVQIACAVEMYGSFAESNIELKHPNIKDKYGIEIGE